ncbi:MAG: Ig domain-containing protein [Lachnospiraceae bacterium]|nr:Ig domain-containing protein [Lachnospiraceae bacterium]
MKKKRKLGRKLLSFLLTLAMVIGFMPGMSLTAYAASEKTVVYDLSVDGKTINKDGVTCMEGFDSYNNLFGGTFTTSNGKFTKIVVNADDVYSIGRNRMDYSSIEGWSLSDYSSATWTGNSSSVQFGTIMGERGNVTITFTIEPSVDVTGVSFNKNTSTLTVGGTETLTATVTPDNATDKTVIWSSDNTAVATVSNGVVTAVAEGTANITVTATNGTDDTSDDKTATCEVTVKKPESTVTKAPTANTLTYNGKAQELVTAGIATGGAMQYALGTATKATQPYTTSIPTGTNAGTYYVWYKAVGDSNHNDSAARCVKVTIGEKKEEKPSPTPDTEAQAPEAKEDSPEAEKQIPASILLNSQFHVSWKGTKAQVTWGSVPNADTYEIYAEYCSKKQCKKISTVHGGNKLTFSQLNGKKLNPKKAVKVYVEAYRGGKKLGRTILGHAAGPKNKRTNAKKVKTSKSTYKLKAGKGAKIKAGTVKESKRKKLLGANHSARYRYATSDMSVATVDKKGRIKAVGAGTCNIWVYAQNGRSKKLTVVVQ